jgi:hypothetical protein
MLRRIDGNEIDDEYVGRGADAPSQVAYATISWQPRTIKSADGDGLCGPVGTCGCFSAGTQVCYAGGGQMLLVHMGVFFGV